MRLPASKPSMRVPHWGRVIVAVALTSILVAWYSLIIVRMIQDSENIQSMELYASRLPASSNTGEATAPSKIWNEMTPHQQDEALQQVIPYIRSIADTLRKTPINYWSYQNHCQVMMIGNPAYGNKHLCNFTIGPDEECTFLSFGIEYAYSFDQELADGWNCRGYAADPTVVHPSELHPGVTFHNIAANTLRPNGQQQDSKKKVVDG